jgi:para-nitrobenzyl esterase
LIFYDLELWVKKNIAHFDGDPNRITIDGHSAGGCSAGLLMISPLGKKP